MLSLIRLRFIRLDYRSFAIRLTLSSSIVGMIFEENDIAVIQCHLHTLGDVFLQLECFSLF